MVRIYHGLEVLEFVDDLRAWAVASNAKTQLIDRLDDLRDYVTMEEEVEKAQAAQGEAEEARDDVSDALRNLVKVCAALDCDNDALEDAVLEAEQALQRSDKT